MELNKKLTSVWIIFCIFGLLISPSYARAEEEIPVQETVQQLASFRRDLRWMGTDDLNSLLSEFGHNTELSSTESKMKEIIENKLNTREQLSRTKSILQMAVSIVIVVGFICLCFEELSMKVREKRSK